MKRSLQIFLLAVALWLIVAPTFLGIASSASPAVPVENVHMIRPNINYGISVSLNDILQKLGPAASQVAGYLSSAQGKNFDFPTWLISNLVSASAGFNFTIKNPLAIEVGMNGETFYPGNPAKLDFSLSGGDIYTRGSMSFHSWLNVSFNVPIPTTPSSSQRFSLYRFDKQFEFVRTFDTATSVNYPKTEDDYFIKNFPDLYQLDRDTVAKIYPPWETPSPDEKSMGRGVANDSGGWVAALYQASYALASNPIYCHPICLGKPVYGLGIGIAPSLGIEGSLSGSIDGPGVHETFADITNSTSMEFMIPNPNAGRIADLASISIHDIRYDWKPSMVLTFFVWGFVINPKALLDPDLSAPRGEPQYFAKIVDIGKIPINFSSQTYLDKDGFSINIPIFAMDKNPLILDKLQIVQVVVIIASVAIVVAARRLRR